MDIYSPRKNYNFSSVKNELKEISDVSGRKVLLIKPCSGVEQKEKPVEVMKKKLLERLKLFFDYQDVTT